MEIAERNLRYKCSDSIHILHSIVRNLSGMFINHQKACWFRDSNLASSSLDVWRSVVLTQIATQSSLHKTPSAVTPVPCRHAARISPLGQGALIFCSPSSVTGSKNRRVSWARQTLRLRAPWSNTGLCRHWHKGFILLGTSGWSTTEMCTKTSMKFSQVSYCHFMRQILVHILISSRKGGVHFQHFC